MITPNNMSPHWRGMDPYARVGPMAAPTPYYVSSSYRPPLPSALTRPISMGHYTANAAQAARAPEKTFLYEVGSAITAFFTGLSTEEFKEKTKNVNIGFTRGAALVLGGICNALSRAASTVAAGLLGLAVGFSLVTNPIGWLLIYVLMNDNKGSKGGPMDTLMKLGGFIGGVAGALPALVGATFISLALEKETTTDTIGHAFREVNEGNEMIGNAGAFAGFCVGCVVGYMAVIASQFAK